MIKLIIFLVILILLLIVYHIAYNKKEKPVLRELLPNVSGETLTLFAKSPISIINFIFNTFKDKDLRDMFGATAVGNSNQSLGTLDNLNITVTQTIKLLGNDCTFTISGLRGLQSSILSSPPTCRLVGNIVYNTSNTSLYAIDVPVTLNFSNVSINTNINYKITDSQGIPNDENSGTLTASGSASLNCIFTYLYNVPVPHKITIVNSNVSVADVNLSVPLDPIVTALVNNVGQGPISSAISSVLPNVVNGIIPNGLLNNLSTTLYNNIDSITKNIDFLTQTLNILKGLSGGISFLTGEGIAQYTNALTMAINNFEEDVSVIQYFLFYRLTLSPPYQTYNMGPYIFRYPVIESKALNVPAVEIEAYSDLPTYEDVTQALNGYKSVTSINCDVNDNIARIKIGYNETASNYTNGSEDPKFISDLTNNFIPLCRTYYCPASTVDEMYNVLNPEPIREEFCLNSLCDTVPITSWNNPEYKENCQYFYINSQGQCAYPGHKSNVPAGTNITKDVTCGSTGGACYYNSSFNLGLCFDSYPMNDSNYTFTDRKTYSKGDNMSALHCYHLQQSPGQEYNSGSYVGINKFKPQYAESKKGLAYYPNKSCGPSCILQGNVGTCQNTNNPCFSLTMLADNNINTVVSANNLYRDQSNGNYDPSFYKCTP